MDTPAEGDRAVLFLLRDCGYLKYRESGRVVHDLPHPRCRPNGVSDGLLAYFVPRCLSLARRALTNDRARQHQRNQMPNQHPFHFSPPEIRIGGGQ
jgi:hypothetical protein